MPLSRILGHYTTRQSFWKPFRIQWSKCKFSVIMNTLSGSSSTLYQQQLRLLIILRVQILLKSKPDCRNSLDLVHYCHHNYGHDMMHDNMPSIHLDRLSDGLKCVRVPIYIGRGSLVLLFGSTIISRARIIVIPSVWKEIVSYSHVLFIWLQIAP